MDRREFLRFAAIASVATLAACAKDEGDRATEARRSPTEAPSPAPVETPAEPPPALSWKRIEAKGPGPRRDYSFAAAGAGSAALLFGGRAGGEPLGDLWSFADGTW